MHRMAVQMMPWRHTSVRHAFLQTARGPLHGTKLRGFSSASVSTTSVMDLYQSQVDRGACRYNAAQLPCLERLDMLHRELSAPNRAPPRGIYIYGEPGAGKTMMMDMFYSLASKQGVASHRAHFHDFMLDMNKSLHRIRKDVGKMADPLALVAQEFVSSTPLLCFDECHVLNVGDALLMCSFFKHLFKAGGTVVATSNLAPEELYSSGINREVFQPFIDAMLDHCDPVRLVVGEDFRATKSAQLAASDGDRAFFWPLGPETDLRLVERLESILGSCPGPRPECLPVPMGRTLQCSRVWRGTEAAAADFSFEELCVAAVGTHDYIALCEAFDVIVVRSVPRFASTDENAARRFASLVDVMYDRQKRLLCTIDAPPGELFASIREQYSGGAEDDRGASVRMPSHGGSSGKHVAQFRLPQSVRYTDSGGYSVVKGNEAPPKSQGDVDQGWVEWSATGLKDASMFDLTCHTKMQQHDRLLPLLRCESRLEEMSYIQLGGLSQ
ncbi:Afg1l [Symbiodinium natans]|uniref:Afg1l protein n=1 Tax=Symbiodinium natans TaxID=878477 RepID=A0A812IZ74_9DINO|nr:Afg1l [Symbiodinium natans]